MNIKKYTVSMVVVSLLMFGAFFGQALGQDAQITVDTIHTFTPQQGSALQASQTFTWNKVAHAIDYFIYVGHSKKEGRILLQNPQEQRHQP